MFYSHTILARNSPLHPVWVAAHLECKIKKPQIDGIDITSSAGPLPLSPSLARSKTLSFVVNSLPSAARAKKSFSSLCS
jgi:hypothetical protein